MINLIILNDKAKLCNIQITPARYIHSFNLANTFRDLFCNKYMSPFSHFRIMPPNHYMKILQGLCYTLPFPACVLIDTDIIIFFSWALNRIHKEFQNKLWFLDWNFIFNINFLRILGLRFVLLNKSTIFSTKCMTKTSWR